MTSTLVVSSGPGEIRAGLFEDDEAVELRVERELTPSLVGAVFLGRILRNLPALGGAFVELGGGRPAFLPKTAGLPEGSAVMVQVTKDAHCDKAPEVTRLLNLPGRYAVWTPGRPGVAVSRRIPPPERARLEAITAPLLAPEEGIVLRSRAAGASEQALAAELEQLRAAGRVLAARAGAARAPARLDPAPTPLQRVLRELGWAADRVVLDDRGVLAAARAELDAPVALAAGADEMAPLHSAFAEALARVVPLAGGGRLIVESTAAFTAIDVDLGTVAGERAPAGEAIRAVNLAAAAATAGQLRLRGIGGAVVVDFVSMTSKHHREEVAAALERLAAEDPTGLELHGWTRLGHYELTRRRTGPAIAELLLGPSGDRRLSPATVAYEVLKAAADSPFRPGGTSLRASPEVVAELTGPLRAILLATEARIGFHLKLMADPLHDPQTFDMEPA